MMHQGPDTTFTFSKLKSNYSYEFGQFYNFTNLITAL